MTRSAPGAPGHCNYRPSRWSSRASPCRAQRSVRRASHHANRPTMKCAPCSGLSPPPPRPVHRHRPGRRHRGGPRSRAGRPGGDGDPVDADLHRRARLLRGQRGDHRGRRRWGRRPLPLHHRGRRALRHRARRQRVPRWRRDHEPREPPRPARRPRRAASAVARSRGWCQRLRRRPVARRRERRRDPRRRRAGEQRRTSLRLRLPRRPHPTRQGRSAATPPCRRSTVRSQRATGRSTCTTTTATTSPSTAGPSTSRSSPPPTRPSWWSRTWRPVVFDVDVSLHLTTTWSDDVDLLLVGPQGQHTVLMSDVGGEQRPLAHRHHDRRRGGGRVAGRRADRGRLLPADQLQRRRRRGRRLPRTGAGRHGHSLAERLRRHRSRGDLAVVRLRPDLRPTSPRSTTGRWTSSTARRSHRAGA